MTIIIISMAISMLSFVSGLSIYFPNFNTVVLCECDNYERGVLVMISITRLIDSAAVVKTYF